MREYVAIAVAALYPSNQGWLRMELQNWKANCVLNDEAHNVGSTWVQDTFSQAHGFDPESFSYTVSSLMKKAGLLPQ